MKSYIINSIMNRNNNVDRKDKDWILDKGRTTIQKIYIIELTSLVI